jgi:anti-sigma B factor antagonist
MPDRVTPYDRAARGVGRCPAAALTVAEVTQMLQDRFHVEVVGGVPVVAAPEEIDITNAAGLRVALLEAASHGHERFVVDMTHTQYCDSSGMHALAAAHLRAVAEDRELLLAVSGGAVLRILALTGFDQMIPSFATLEEALGRATGAVGGSRLVD